MEADPLSLSWVHGLPNGDTWSLRFQPQKEAGLVLLPFRVPVPNGNKPGFPNLSSRCPKRRQGFSLVSIWQGSLGACWHVGAYACALWMCLCPFRCVITLIKLSCLTWMKWNVCTFRLWALQAVNICFNKTNSRCSCLTCSWVVVVSYSIWSMVILWSEILISGGQYAWNNDK